MKLTRWAAAFALAMGAVSGSAMAVEQGGFFAADLGMPSYGIGGSQPTAIRIGGGANFVTLLDGTMTIGVEGDYINFGEAKYTFFNQVTKLKTTGIMVAGLVNWDIPHVKGLGVVGRVGFLRSNSTYTSVNTLNPAAGISYSSTSTGLYYGAGVRYTINRSLDVRAMYEQFGSPAGAPNGVSYGLDMLSAGIVVKF